MPCGLMMLGTLERSHNRCVATLGSGKLGVFGVRCLVRPAIGSDMAGVLCGLTFELSGRQRQDASARTVKMYRVPPARAWWPAVVARFPQTLGRTERPPSRSRLPVEPSIALQTPLVSRNAWSHLPIVRALQRP